MMSKIHRNSRLTALEKAHERCFQHRDFEITQLVQRNNFFILFQGFLFAGVVALSDPTDTKLRFILSVLGVLMSYFQWKAAAGAKFWQEYWEAKLSTLEKELKKYPEYRRLSIPLAMENNYKEVVTQHLENYGTNKIKSWLILSHGSVSAIPIYIGISCFLIWFFLMGYFLGILILCIN